MEIFLLLFAAYFIPTAVAIVRRHHNEGAIITLNLLLGWTFIGWVAALVWSLTSPPRPMPEQTKASGHGKADTDAAQPNQLQTALRHMENILEACREVSKPAFYILVGVAQSDGKISRDDVRIIANLFAKHGADIKPAWIESLAALNAGVSMSVKGDQQYDEEIAALESASPAFKAGIYGAYIAMTVGNKRQTAAARRIGEQLEALLTTPQPAIKAEPAAAVPVFQPERNPLPTPGPRDRIPVPAPDKATVTAAKKPITWVEQAQKEIEEERRRKTTQRT